MKSKPSQAIGLFMLTLILTLPFYSASALAANMQVVSNHGDENIEGFLDAQGDTWKVQVQINGVDTVPDPAQVRMVIGDNQAAFTSCTQGAVGFLCDYLSPVGVAIRERGYPFKVIYNLDLTHPNDFEFNPHTSGTVQADGTAPVIIGQPTAHQDPNTGEIILNLHLKDRPESGAGISKVEIVDADSNQIIQTIDLVPAQRDYIFAEDSNHNGRLPRFEGVGLRRMKVRAYDALGHVTNTAAFSFATDSVAPAIHTETLRFVDRGEFTGPFESFATLTVNVTETSEKPTVTASAPETDLDGREADCILSDTQNVHLCSWTNVRIPPVSSLTITLDAVDGFNNKVQTSRTLNFVQDLQAPEIVLFGTNTIFEDQSYITKDLNDKHPQQKVVLIINEQGAGVTINTVKSNLGALGDSTLKSPDRCDIIEGQYRCEWDVNPKSFSSEGVAVLTLPQFDDVVENTGATQEVPVIVDIHGPVVDKLSVFGVSEAGDKDYFQSGDALKIKFNVTERSGLQILVGMHDLATDLETKFPETPVSEGLGAGYQIFDHSSCTRKAVATEGGETIESFVWDCEIVTDAIKSGPDTHAEFQLIIRDTAGNDGQFLQDAKNVEGNDGKYSLNLLGLMNEEVSPDFWEVSSATPRAFVDLDTTHLIAARLPVSVALKQKTPNVEALDIRLEGCAIATPAAASGEPSVVNSVSERANREAAEAPAEAPAEESFTNPTISNAILYGGLQGIEQGQTTPQVMFMLEFAPFDGKEQFIERLKSLPEAQASNFIDVPITCNLQVFSKLGSNAISSPEQQPINFSAQFGFTKIGALDENLKKKIDGIKDQLLFEITEVTTYINEVIKWVKYATSIIQIINNVITIYQVFTVGLEPLQATQLGSPIAVGICKGNNAAEYSLVKGVEYLQIPLAILSCDPRAVDKSGEQDTLFGAYGGYQVAVLNSYNAWSGRGLVGLGANSLYENIWTSTIGLCGPGIVHNLEKYREVQCRKIVCYKEDVPIGVATVESCQQLGDYLDCRYWKGSLAATGLPLIGLFDAVTDFIKGWISSPVGLVRAALQLPCALDCAINVGLSGYCTFSAVTVRFFDIIDGIAGLYYSFPTKTGGSYCDRI